MKAKFIAVKENFEVRLENGTVFASTPNETKQAFLDRVKSDASLEVDGELEMSELTTEAFKNLGLEKLKVAKGKEAGLLKQLITQAITEKEAAIKADADKVKADKKAEAEKAKAEKAAKIAEEKEAKEKAKTEAAKDKPTLEEVLEMAKAAKENVGHKVMFAPHRTAIKTEGVINGVWVDKRVPMALYRIFDADGVMFNKVLSAPDLEIGELAPNPKAEEKAKKAAEKEEAAKAKAEAAEKKAAEKAEAAKAKAEAAEKAKAEKEAKAKADAEAKAAAEAKTIADKLAEAEAKIAAETKIEKDPEASSVEVAETKPAAKGKGKTAAKN